MDTSQLLVTIAGLTAIVGVNWYFFIAGRVAPATAAPGGSGPQEISIVVDGGYTPATISVEHGRPVRLLFDRRDQGSCTEEVVLPDFGVRRFLPAGQVTPIEFTPTEPGIHEFACGMGMVRGKLLVR